MKNDFHGHDLKASSVSADTLPSLITFELDAIIFPDGLKEAVRLECEKMIPAFLLHIYNGRETESRFLPEFDRVLMENRLRSCSAPLIARIWICLTEKLVKEKVIANLDLEILFWQMKSVAAKHDILL